jgi:hypothetical protein
MKEVMRLRLAALSRPRRTPTTTTTTTTMCCDVLDLTTATVIAKNAVVEHQ